MEYFGPGRIAWKDESRLIGLPDKLEISEKINDHILRDRVILPDLKYVERVTPIIPLKYPVKYTEFYLILGRSTRHQKYEASLKLEHYDWLSTVR